MQIETVILLLASFAVILVLFLNPKKGYEDRLTEGKYRAMLDRMTKLEARVDILQNENAALKGHIALLEARNKILNNDFTAAPSEPLKSPADLLKQGYIKAGLEMLLAQEKDDEKADTFVMLLSQYARAQRQSMQRLIDGDSYERRLSSITSAALNLIDSE